MTVHVDANTQMAHTTDPLQAFILSRDAVGLANEAFFDPSMMGLLYFVRPSVFHLFSTTAMPCRAGAPKAPCYCWDPILTISLTSTNLQYIPPSLPR